MAKYTQAPMEVEAHRFNGKALVPGLSFDGHFEYCIDRHDYSIGSMENSGPSIWVEKGDWIVLFPNDPGRFPERYSNKRFRRLFKPASE